MRYGNITMENGKICYHSFSFYRSSIQDIAGDLSEMDILNIFSQCYGDFSLIDDQLAAAIANKLILIKAAKENQLERRKETRKEEAQEFHRSLMVEIKHLMGEGTPFTTLDVQLAARQRGNGYPVRTRQLYNIHLCKACADNEVITVNDTTSSCINVILRNGKHSTQRIPGANRYCTFQFV